MIGAKINTFCEQLLVRDTGTTLIHVLNGIHEIDSNLAALVLKYIEHMVARSWKIRLIYVMRTPGEDMRLQWTFWNMVNIGGIAEGHILGEHVIIRDIREYAGANKLERVSSLLDKEGQLNARPLKILCVCTGNVDRSPLVEAYLKHELGKLGLEEAISVESRGILPAEKRPASPPTVQIAAELGIDLSRHRARKLLRREVQNADLILAMKEKHYRAVLKMDPSAEYRTMLLNIDDPAMELYLWEDIERYRDVLLQVKNATAPFLQNLASKTDQIRLNLQTGGFPKRLTLLDHFDELSAHSDLLQNRALLIADDVLWENERLTRPSFFPQQAMGIIALSLLASVGQPQFSQMVKKDKGVFLFKRIPRLTPPW